MMLRSVRALRGPNVWADVPVLEVAVADDGPADPALNGRLVERLPELDGRLSADTPADLLAQLTLALQTLAGSPVGFAASSRRGDHRLLAIEYEEEPLGRRCLEAAAELLGAAGDGLPFDGPARLLELKEAGYFACLGPSTRAIVAAARERGIPFRRLNDGSLVLLGQGTRQRRILTAETDRTGAVAESIAQDKELTRTLLRSVGVPVPEGRQVADADDAWTAAREVGVPVVVKPLDANHARGVATNLTTREQVTAAYEAALKEGTAALVERYAPGRDHRLLVIGDRLVAATRREPPTVAGDGRSTIRELVERINADPARGDGFITPLGRIKLDDQADQVLTEQGYDLDSVPPAGVAVTLRRQSHIITGGVAHDVTDRVHPEVAARAVEAAQVIGLDVAGIDIVAEDVGRPLEDQRGVIVEVNAGPGLGLHLPPWADPSREVGKAIVGLVFPEGDGRIPVVAVTGGSREAVAASLAELLHAAGVHVGRAGAKGLALDGRPFADRPADDARGAIDLLLNPKAEAAVLAIDPARIVDEGLGFDRARVAVVTDANDPAAGRVLLRAAGPEGVAVLNADDPGAWGLAPAAGPTIAFAERLDHPAIRAHLAGGGRAVVREGRAVALRDGAGETVIINAPADSLAAVAALWGLGYSPESVADALLGDEGRPNRAVAHSGASNIF